MALELQTRYEIENILLALSPEEKEAYRLVRFFITAYGAVSTHNQARTVRKVELHARFADFASRLGLDSELYTLGREGECPAVSLYLAPMFDSSDKISLRSYTKFLKPLSREFKEWDLVLRVVTEMCYVYECHLKTDWTSVARRVREIHGLTEPGGK